MRWQLRLEEYNYNIECRKEKENTVANALSQLYPAKQLPKIIDKILSTEKTLPLEPLDHDNTNSDPDSRFLTEYLK